MDKGAHFYKTDFQIHSPRSSNWGGGDSNRPITDLDRLHYAFELVKKWREESIDAVAITDHDDVCFCKYFQLAAQLSSEQDIAKLQPFNFSDIPDWTKQNPIIFPGVEILFQNGYQVIVILDADCDVTIQNLLLYSIGITPPSDQEPKGPDSVSLRFNEIKELKERLDEKHELTGKYIILPNVTPNGFRTLKKKDLREIFKNIPCVGGYIEKKWEDISENNKFLFDKGRSRYGSKPLGIFQTSDFRDLPHNYINLRHTWVKMAEATAESLRQACLAKESRISQVEPIIPTRYISKIEVSDSRFMGPIAISLNPQYNALIGGRGTGKSTILEYLRFGLHDQILTEERRKFINNTLVNLKPVLKIHWIIEGSHQTIVNDFSDNIKWLQVEGGPPKQITEDYIRQNFPIQSYSQKQLSTVSNRTEELQRFVVQPIQEAVKAFDEKIDNLRKECSGLYQEVIQKNKKERNKSDLIAQKGSLEAQKEAIQKALPTIDKETQDIINQYPQRKSDLTLVVSYENKISEILAGFDELHGDISVGLSLPEGAEDLPSETDEVFNKADELLEKAGNAIENFQRGISGDKKDFDELTAYYENAHREFLQRYEDASKKTLAHQGKIQQLKAVMDSLNNVENRIGELEKEIKSLENVESEFSSKFQSWVSLHNQKADSLEGQCEQLNMKSGGEIEAVLKRGADIDEAIRKLDEAIKGARISSDRWDALKKTIVDADSPVETWSKLIQELRLFAELEIGDVLDEEKIPSLASWDLSPNAKRVIIERLTPDKWFEIAFTSLNDIPVFYYQKNRDNIPFEDASAGQQATALLKVLLQEEKGPLLIDQPEDDLDKKVVGEIIGDIWQAKQKRQIIFASHDANLVVNGDAELVIYCDYESETDRSKGKIENSGSIDIKEIRDAITTIMEGGQKAFDLRKKKYGF